MRTFTLIDAAHAALVRAEAEAAEAMRAYCNARAYWVDVYGPCQYDLRELSPSVVARLDQAEAAVEAALERYRQIQWREDCARWAESERQAQTRQAAGSVLEEEFVEVDYPASA